MTSLKKANGLLVEGRFLTFRKHVQKWIIMQSGMRACREDFFRKINNRACTIIRETRVLFSVMTNFICQHGSYELVHNFHHLLQAFSFLTTKMCNLPGMKSHSLHGKKKKSAKLETKWVLQYIKTPLKIAICWLNRGFSEKKLTILTVIYLIKKWLSPKCWLNRGCWLFCRWLNRGSTV